MRVLLVVNDLKDKDYKLSNEIINYLLVNKVEVVSSNDNLVNNFKVKKLEDSDFKTIDFSIVLGGDGTILKYACNYAKYDIPYVGINLGRVGALALLEKDNYKLGIDKILKGEYYIIDQLGLDGKINFKDKKESITFTSYNDIVLHRGLSLKLLPIVIGVNNTKKDLFYADGIIVSTPIGSSAYNASSGGPLLAYGCDSYVLTPICPQSKSFIPLVVNDTDVVSLSTKPKVNINDGEVILSVDGYFKYFISPEDEILISKSRHTLKMICFDKQKSVYTSVYKAVASIEKREEK